MLFVLVALVGTACTDNKALPDLDATVKARVATTIAAKAPSRVSAKLSEPIPSEEYIEIVFTPSTYKRINSLKETVTNILVEFLITNAHPTKAIDINRVGWEFGKQSVNYSGYGVQRHQINPCIVPGETVRVRFNSKVDATSYGVDDFKYQQVRSSWCEPLIGIDESLLEEVSVDITRDDGMFTVAITNDSLTYIGWTGELLRKDVEGNIITKTPFILPSVPCIKPGGRTTFDAKSSLDFFGKEYEPDNLNTIYSGMMLVEPEFRTIELYKCN